MLRWLSGTEPYVPDAPAPAVAISLKTGSTILGALIHQEPDYLVVRAGTLIGVDRNQAETREPLDGDTVVPLDNIDFWQTGIDPKIVARISEE
jgi:hypothetical protein